MFKDPIECYEAIGNALSNATKEAWDSIVLDASLDGVKVDVVVSYWRRDQSQAVGYLTGVPRLASFIYDLAHLVVSTENKGLFKKCIFTLQSNGTFNVDFIY